jgi:hypothetical protein
MFPSPYREPFVSAHLRASIVKIILIVGAAVTGLALLVETLSFVFSPITDDQDLADNPAGALLVLAIALLAMVELIIYLTTVVFFCVWLYRAYKNLRALNDSRHINHSPGWAVGSFFVPFVNLVVPYGAVKETWQKSGPPGEALYSEPKPPAWFPIWWLFWLLSSFAGNASFRASFDENIPLSAVTILSIVAGGLSVIASLFAYLVVDSIDKRQEETAARLKLGNLAAPPPPPPDLSAPDAVAGV